MMVLFWEQQKNVTLPRGYKIDRYGDVSGSFVSPEGVPFEQRSIRPGSGPYHLYEVCKPVRSEGSIIAPWFDQPGGGMQFKLEKPIHELLNEGIIREIK